MSSEEELPPICEYCGMVIEDEDQECHAHDPGEVTCDPDPYGYY